jgi:transposase-like protein
MSKPLTVHQFFRQFPDDDTCLEHLFRTRFGEQVACPSCNKVSKFYKIASEQAYSCQWCGWHVHPMVGTPFEKTHMPLQRWFYAMYLFTTTRHGVSAKELQRQFGCSYKAAWRMGHEIRKYMALLDSDGPLDGEVEVDETLVGGRDPEGRRGRDPKSNKTVVFAMLDRESGEVITRVVPDSKARTLKPIIAANVAKGSKVHTDEWSGYRRLDKWGYDHSTVNHADGEYARDGSHVNTLEGYFSLLKRSIRATHTWVSPKYLPNYLCEFEYRMNLRSAPELMWKLMLSFRRLPVASPSPSHP